MDSDDVIGTLLRHPGHPIILEAVNVHVEDPRLLEVLDPDVPLLSLYEHATFSEGTVWDARRRRLVWSDVDGRRVLAWYPDGRVEVVVEATAFIKAMPSTATATLSIASTVGAASAA